MAASLVAAFIVGSISRKLWFSMPVVNEPQKMVAMTEEKSALGTDATDSAQERQTYKVSLQMPDGQTVDVPVEQATDRDVQSLLTEEKPLLSEVERQALESTGHQIEQRREVYPMRLNDGRQLLVPVDYVRIQDARWQ